jgi:hypothetical protein
MRGPLPLPRTTHLQVDELPVFPVSPTPAPPVTAPRLGFSVPGVGRLTRRGIDTVQAGATASRARCRGPARKRFTVETPRRRRGIRGALRGLPLRRWGVVPSVRPPVARRGRTRAPRVPTGARQARNAQRK